MVARWNGSPMYSFGYMIPFVAAFLIWTRRERLAGVEPQSARLAGAAVLVLWLTLMAAGGLAGVQVLQQFAFLVALVAAVLLLFGGAALRTTWMAWAYLTLMIPFWDGLTEPLHLPSQNLSAMLGTQMLDVAGVPAYREGTLLHLPSITIEVARACSGVNYLVAVVALGIPLAYLFLPGLWRRAALILLAVATAAMSNGLRVALIGLLAHWDVGSPLHGPFHVLHGLFVSGVGYAVLFVGLRVLRPGTGPSIPSPPDIKGASGRQVPAFSLCCAAVLTGLFVLAGALPTWVEPVTVSTPARSNPLPFQVGPWTSIESPVTADTWWDLPDEQLGRRYQRSPEETVDVWIGYYRSQRQGKELVSHRTERLHRVATRVTLGPDATREANLVRLRVADRERIGFFWYDIDGRQVAGKYRAKWLTFRRALLRRRNDGAIVVVLSDKAHGESAEGQIERLADFCRRFQKAYTH